MTDAVRIATEARNELRQTDRAFGILEQNLLQGIADSDPTATAEREALYFQIIAARKVRLSLIAAASTLDIEEHIEAQKSAG